MGSSEENAEKMWEDIKAWLSEFFGEYDEQTLLIFGVVSSIVGIGLQIAVSRTSKKREEKRKADEAANPKVKADAVAEESVEEGGDNKKSIPIAYTLLTFGGFQGAHHFYLGDTTTGAAFVFTFGYLGLGVLHDWVTLWWKIIKKNRKATKPHAMGLTRLFINVMKQIPIVIAGLWLVVVGLGFGLPLFMHYTGMVDLYQKRGNLSVSALGLLEVGPFVSYDELKRNYKRLSIKYHPDRCGTECTTQMQELNVAYDLVKGGIIDPEALLEDWVTVDESFQGVISPYKTFRDEWDRTSDVMTALQNTVVGEKKKGKKGGHKKKEAEKEKHTKNKSSSSSSSSSSKSNEKKKPEPAPASNEENIDELPTDTLIDMLGEEYDREALKKLFAEGDKKKAKRMARERGEIPPEEKKEEEPVVTEEKKEEPVVTEEKKEEVKIETKVKTEKKEEL